jgi:hypothetical protein
LVGEPKDPSTTAQKNLQVTSVPGPGDPLILYGSATVKATPDSSIAQVFADAYICAFGTNPVTTPCNGGPLILTLRTLDSPINVSPGQVVTVSVTITFS